MEKHPHKKLCKLRAANQIPILQFGYSAVNCVKYSNCSQIPSDTKEDGEDAGCVLTGSRYDTPHRDLTPAAMSYSDDNASGAKTALDSVAHVVHPRPAMAIVASSIPREVQMEGGFPMASANTFRGISIREIQQTVAVAFNLSVRDMVSPSRRRQVTRARHVAMYLSREMAMRQWRPSSSTIEAPGRGGPSFPRIGIAFARDHSSVIHACTAVKRRLRDDLGFALLLNRLAGDLRDHAMAAATAREAI